jgi:hypothetical protein
MSCTDEVVRMISKLSDVEGEKPTIPPSDNHRDGSWVSTDIYKGEIFVNQADGLVWTRAEIDGVDQIITVDGYTDLVEFVLNQSSTNAPIPYHTKGTLGGGVFAYSSTGVYTYTLASSFPQSRVIAKHPQLGQATQSIKVEWTSVNEMTIKTFSGGVAANDILVEFGLGIYILPERTPAS